MGGYRALGDILSHFLNNFFVSQEFLKMSFLKQLELGERTCFSWFYYLMESILHSQWCLVVLSFFLLFPQLLSDLDWVWHCSSWCKCCCHTLDCVSQRNWYLQNYSRDLTIFNWVGSSLDVCFCPYINKKYQMFIIGQFHTLKRLIALEKYFISNKKRLKLFLLLSYIAIKSYTFSSFMINSCYFVLSDQLKK